MQLKCFCFIIFLSSACLSVQSQQLDFFREDLTFQIDSTNFTVSGQYFFRNNSSSQRQTLINYPLPRLTDGPLFDTILVFSEESPAKPLELYFHDTLVSFRITVEPVSDKQITIFYSQQHNGNYAKYILTTTKYWGKPLQLAEFRLVVPPYINIQNCFEPPDKISEFDDVSIYYWKRQNFSPSHDFEIWFEPSPKLPK
jgi:hypothetical protein